MTRYIEKEVDLRYNFPPCWNHRQFKNRLKKALENYADGLFRWVELQLDIFFDERLPFETEEDAHGELQNLESGSSIPGQFVDQKARLNTAYDNILNKRRKIARTTIAFALRWVLCSEENLLAKELVEETVLSLEHASTKVASRRELGPVSSQEVRQLCSNFIQLGDDMSFVKLSHHSVKEYLLDTNWCNCEFVIETCHSFIAEICLWYIYERSTISYTLDTYIYLHAISHSEAASNNGRGEQYAHLLEFFRRDPLKYLMKAKDMASYTYLRINPETACPMNRLTVKHEIRDSLIPQHCLNVAAVFFIALKGLPGGIGDTTKTDNLMVEKTIRDSDKKTMEFIEWSFSHLSLNKIRAAVRNSRHPGFDIPGVIKRHFDKLPEYLQTCEIAIGLGSDGVPLLDILLREANELLITDKIVGMAAGSRGSEELLAVILRHRRDTPITENILVQAAKNGTDGNRAMKVLVEHASRTIQISGKVLYTVSSNRLCMLILDYLFESLKEEIDVSEVLMVAIAARSFYPMEFFKTLFKYRQETYITKAVILALVENKNIPRGRAQEAFDLFLSHDHKVSLTEDVFVAITRNYAFGLNTMNHLLEKEQAIRITPHIISTALMTGDFGEEDDRRYLKSFLDRCPDSYADGEAAASNKEHGYEAICMIQNSKNDMKIENRVVEAAAGNDTSGKRILEWIFEHAPDMEISDHLLEIAAKKGNAQGLGLLLDRIDQSRVTDELFSFLLKATMGCVEPYTHQTAKTILDRAGMTFPISEDILITAFRTPMPRGSMYPSPIGELLDGDRPAVISEKVLQTAVKHCYDESYQLWGIDYVKILLEKNENLSVPERLITTAITNRNMSEASFGSLLDRAQCRITYGMLKGAAETDQACRQAAARNKYYSKNSFETLLGFTKCTVLTENVLIAAAQSSGQSMDVILSDWKHDIQISPAVLKAVASNERWEFFSIMQILLHRYGDIEITEDVLEAARNNKTMRSALTALLRKHQQQHNMSSCDNDE
ncbi:hypothetical protein F5Y02DRAFT_419182 [Annulohypoxylon stygium]|nr:hypothetical protein F5Y02DRAFT_419182 [Annulohypoxylon stygium]